MMKSRWIAARWSSSYDQQILWLPNCYRLQNDYNYCLIGGSPNFRTNFKLESSNIAYLVPTVSLFLSASKMSTIHMYTLAIDNSQLSSLSKQSARGPMLLWASFSLTQSHFPNTSFSAWSFETNRPLMRRRFSATFLRLMQQCFCEVFVPYLYFFSKYTRTFESL